MVKKSKKRTKRRSKPRQRKQRYTTPVDAYKDLVKPKGLLFGEGWLPYVQRLTYAPLPPPPPPQGQVSGPTLNDVRELILASANKQEPPPISRLVSRKSRSFGPVEPLAEPQTSYDAYVPPPEVKPMKPSDDTVNPAVSGSTAMVPVDVQGPPKDEDIIRLWYFSMGIPAESQNWFVYPDNRPEYKKKDFEKYLLEFWSSDRAGQRTQSTVQKYLKEKLTKSKGVPASSAATKSTSVPQAVSYTHLTLPTNREV